MDQPQTYDYWKDTYENPIRPYLGYAGSRPAANMKPLNTPLLPIEKRVQTDYTENEFESLEMGIGLSLLEKEREKLVEKKKQMVYNFTYLLPSLLIFIKIISLL